MSDTARIQVTDSVFDCDTCANTVERVLEKTAGVETVEIDAGANRVTVGYDTGRIEAEEIQQVVEEWGYTAAGSD